MSGTNTARPDADLPFWERLHYLDRMTLRELAVAYFRHYTIIAPKRSKTVFNLGYDEDVAKTYPWGKDLSGGIATGHPRRRALAKNNHRATA